MTKFRTLILIGAMLTSGSFAANASAGVSGMKSDPNGVVGIGAIVAINPQPLPPIDRDREDEGFDLSALGAGVDLAINPQPLPPIEREREEDIEDLG